MEDSVVAVPAPVLPAGAPIPTLSQWGIALLFMLLTAAAAFHLEEEHVVAHGSLRPG
ncbi:MAG: hypothetical protein ACRESZ_17420 [Methylococcales bacterium]